MKKLHFGFIALCFVLYSQNLSAQEVFATLKKNTNTRASSLLHDLNTSKDTLILKSEKNINYVYSINRNYKREIDKSINAKEFKVPLKQLSKGKHVMVVGQSRMKIVFVVWVGEEPSFKLIKSDVLITSNDN